MAAGLVAAQLCAALASTYVVHRTVGISLRHEEVARGMRLLLAYGLPLALTGLAGKRSSSSIAWSSAVISDRAVRGVRRRCGGAPAHGVVQHRYSVLVPALPRHMRRGLQGGAWRRAFAARSRPPPALRVLHAHRGCDGPSAVRRQLRAECRRLPHLPPAGAATSSDIRPDYTGDRAYTDQPDRVVRPACRTPPSCLRSSAPLGLIGAGARHGAGYLRNGPLLPGPAPGGSRTTIRALFPWPMLAVNLALSALAAIPAALLVLAGVDGLLAAPWWRRCFWAVLPRGDGVRTAT